MTQEGDAMRALVLVAICATAVLMLTPAPAGADGGAVFDFQEEFIVPGEVAEATTPVWMGEKDLKRLELGPYQAYLVPDEKWIEPPRIPTEAIPIGVIEFTPPDRLIDRQERKFGSQKGLATISFVVPDVQTASYGLYYCNDPCTVATIGDLTGGWIRIAEDAEEAQLLAERERFMWKARSLEWRVGRARKQIDRLTGEAEITSGEASDLRARVAGLERRLGAASNPDESGLAVAPLLAAGLGGLLLGLLLRRRRQLALTASPVEEAERILEGEGTVTIHQAWTASQRVGPIGE